MTPTKIKDHNIRACWDTLNSEADRETIALLSKTGIFPVWTGDLDPFDEAVARLAKPT